MLDFNEAQEGRHMAKKQSDNTAAAIMVSEYFPLIEAGGTCYSGPVCAVQPDVPVLAVLEHAGYVLTAADLFADVLSDGYFSEPAQAQNAAMGLHYLTQLAQGLVGAAVGAMQMAQGAQ
jgi:hypothetical protein